MNDFDVAILEMIFLALLFVQFLLYGKISEVKDELEVVRREGRGLWK